MLSPPTRSDSDTGLLKNKAAQISNRTKVKYPGHLGSIWMNSWEWFEVRRLTQRQRRKCSRLEGCWQPFHTRGSYQSPWSQSSRLYFSYSSVRWRGEKWSHLIWENCLFYRRSVRHLHPQYWPLPSTATPSRGQPAAGGWSRRWRPLTSDPCTPASSSSHCETTSAWGTYWCGTAGLCPLRREVRWRKTDQSMKRRKKRPRTAG